MTIYRWINKAKERYYKITIEKQESEIILNYKWGSNISNRGGKKSISVCSEQEAFKAIEKMMRRRKTRGYELIAS